MAKKKVDSKGVLNQIAEAKSIEDLVAIMKDVPVKTKDISYALYLKMEEFMPKRIK